MGVALVHLLLFLPHHINRLIRQRQPHRLLVDHAAGKTLGAETNIALRDNHITCLVTPPVQHANPVQINGRIGRTGDRNAQKSHGTRFAKLHFRPLNSRV
ncbi:TPA: hypothetical protein VDU83_002634 [Pseudomonas aeruginosa]|nr:hypothetical protein [Pseudomonas aeruginosa]